jgi:hypothetical protein
MKEAEKPKPAPNRGARVFLWTAVVLVGFAAAAGAILAVGGYLPDISEFKWPAPADPPKPVDTALEKKKSLMTSAVRAARTFEVIDLGIPQTPPDPGDRRPVIQCLILGVVPDATRVGKFTHLLVNFPRDDDLVGAQPIDVRDMKDEFHDYINTRFTTIRSQPPDIWEGKTPEDAEWLEPDKIGRLGCAVRCTRLDAGDRFVDPLIENLLR